LTIWSRASGSISSLGSRAQLPRNSSSRLAARFTAVCFAGALAVIGCSGGSNPTASPANSSTPAPSNAQGHKISFIATGSMASRYFNTATLLQDGRVLVAGGCCDGQTGLATAQIYNPLTGAFTATGSMTTPRYEHTATLLQDGRVLLTGGFSELGGLASAEIYDPKAGTFSPTGSMSVARLNHTATLLQDGRVLIAGGTSSTTALDSAEIFDPKTGTFSPTGYDDKGVPDTMSRARIYQTATLLNDGRVLIIGGDTLATGDIFDPKTGQFKPTRAPLTALVNHTATLMNDGRVLIVGGRQVGLFTFDSAEIFDPTRGTETNTVAKGTFTATGSMTTARFYHTATLLRDGRVLITGGYPGLDSAEVFDPKTGKFTATPGRMTLGRARQTATLLNDNTVLIAGGIGSSGSSTSAELYQP
jgi:hypothetical protein